MWNLCPGSREAKLRAWGHILTLKGFLFFVVCFSKHSVCLPPVLGFWPCVLEASLCLCNCSNFFPAITFLFFFSKSHPSFHFFFISCPRKFHFLAGSSCSLWQYFTQARIVVMIKVCTGKGGLTQEPRPLTRLISSFCPLLCKLGTYFPVDTVEG